MQSNSFFLSLPLLDSILFGMRLIRQFFRDLQDISSKTWPKKLLRIIIATWGLHHQLLEQNWIIGDICNSWMLITNNLNKSSWPNFSNWEVQMILKKALHWPIFETWIVQRFDQKILTTIFATWEVQMNLNKIGILDYFEILINNNLTKSSCRQLIVSWEVQTFWTKLEFLITCIWNAHQ